MASRAGTVAALSIGAAALVAVGAGTGAVAATQITGKQIKDGTVTSADIKNETLRSGDVLNGTLTGSDIKNGTVGKADLASGVLPRASTIHVPGVVDLPAGAGSTTVLELPLPPGTYLLAASGALNNNDTAATVGAEVCALVAGSTSVDVAQGLKLAPNLAPADTQWFSGSSVATLSASGSAKLECVRSAGWKSGNVVRPTITAVSVQRGSVVLDPLSVAGSLDQD